MGLAERINHASHSVKRSNPPPAPYIFSLRGPNSAFLPTRANRSAKELSYRMKANCILFILFLVLAGPFPAWPGTDDPCAKFLLGTLNSLNDEKAKASELQSWSSVPATIDYLQIFHDVREFLFKAPQEVRDTLGLVVALTFRDDDRDRAFAKQTGGDYMVPELEVFFGTEMIELASTMRALHALTPYLSVDAQSYLETVTAHPSRHFVLALLLHHLARDLKRQPVDEDYQRQRSGLSWLPREQILRAPMTSTAAASTQFVQSFYRLNHPAGQPSRMGSSDNDNPTRSSTEPPPTPAPDADEAAMIHWVAEKLFNHDLRNEPERPAAWLRLYKEASEFLRTPVSHNPQVQTIGGVRITQSRLTPTAETVATILTDLDRKVIYDFHEFYGNLLAFAPVGEDRAQWHRDRLDFAFEQKFLATPWGITVFASMLNLSEPVISGKDLPILAINQLRKLVVERLKEFFPVPREIAGAVSETKSQDLATGWGPHFEEPFWAEVFEPATKPQAPANDDGALRIDFFVDKIVPLTVVKAGIPYVVEFRRRDSNFKGDQIFVFEEKALNDVMKGWSRSIEPMLWFQAIREGIARPNGQAGLKILKSDKVNGLRFEVKILSSPYRIFGHYKAGQWTLGYIADEH